LATELKKRLGLESDLIPGGGGNFIVVVDGKEIFSKKKVGRFPEVQEILGALDKT
jgi:selT/selW/selH-like putative selenoprotein